MTGNPPAKHDRHHGRPASLTDIRGEKPEDVEAIREITTAAFKGAEHSSGTEAAIVDSLRAANALTISLVAVENDEIVGHVAFSPVRVESGDGEWFGLGPVSVRPDRQGSGIGKALIESGLAQLRDNGANGCVVLGDPRYYTRFGFVSDLDLRYAEVPPSIFNGLYSADQHQPERSRTIRGLTRAR